MREQIFVLTYVMKGLHYDNIMELEPREREWYLNRLYQQKQRETAAMGSPLPK